jgi:anti-anti-sigma factor
MEMDVQPRMRRASIARRRRTGPDRFYNQVYDDGSVLVVTPTGELDVATVPSLAEVVRRCTDRYRVLVLSLARVTFMDSQAIGLLLELRNGPCGDRLALVPPPASVGAILDRLGARPLFHWVSSPAEELHRVLGRRA